MTTHQDPAVALFQIAQLHHRAGQLDQAVDAYETLLGINPDNPDALQYLGLIHLQREQPEEAEGLFLRALELAPNDPTVRYHWALCLERLGRAKGVYEVLNGIIKDTPLYIEAHRKKALMLLAFKIPHEALEAAQDALKLFPDDFDLHVLLIEAYNLTGQIDSAMSAAREALERWPDDRRLLLAYTDSVIVLEQFDQAIPKLQAAWQRYPDDIEIALQYCRLLDGKRQFPMMLEVLKPWIDKEDMGYEPVVLYLYARALEGAGRAAEAIESLERAAEASPENPSLRNSLGALLVETGDFARGSEHMREASIAAKEPILYSNYLFTSQYDPSLTALDLRARHEGFHQVVANYDPDLKREFANVPDPNRKIRIGLVTADLAHHPVGFFTLSWLARHNRDRFEVFAYSGRRREDHITKEIRYAADHWIRTDRMLQMELCQRILDDKIDIAFDLSGHTAGNRLEVLALRPAPVQATWAGYVGTTGMAEMDWIIADRYHIPPELEHTHRERIMRMPDGYICYEPNPRSPTVGPLPALGNGYVTFGSFNNVRKLSAACVALFARVLKAVPDSKLFLKYKGMASDVNIKRLGAAFEAHGISRDRLILEEGGSPMDMLFGYHKVDICLDTMPYSGGLTTCEALWMGTPVITLPGDRFCSRHSYSHLSNAGASECIASSEEEYVAIAKGFADDLERLANFRYGIRERMAASPLCDPDRFAENFEQALIKMWHDWCAKQAA
ncbi:tetratricopeptide repeat protein [Lacibacterium aquatile]|uniref:protein O-GlcNAc transferase n=1 Tax=Lacibacterium aquatile TaxID=1168082 RepID=A0ABW5DNK6_9PROT